MYNVVPPRLLPQELLAHVRRRTEAQGAQDAAWVLDVMHRLKVRAV